MHILHSNAEYMHEKVYALILFLNIMNFLFLLIKLMRLIR